MARNGGEAGSTGAENGDEERSSSSESTPTTSEVRIAAPEAGVAAGIVEEPSAEADGEGATEPDVGGSGQETVELTAAYELQDWVDPPTGQVPRILLDDPDLADATVAVPRGPVWREEGADWDEDLDLSFLSSEEDVDEIAGRVEPTEAPFEFAFEELEPTTSTDEEVTQDEEAWKPLFDASSNVRRRHRRPARAHRAPTRAGRRNVVTATATATAFAVLAIVCFLLGSQATVALVAVVATVAAGEAFLAMQKSGFRPATLVGLLATPALVIAGYLHGPIGVVEVLGVVVIATGAWHLSPLGRVEPIMNAGATLFVISWVGLFASFAGLLLSPAAFPHRHGVAFVVALVALTAAYDVGAYGIGARFGQRHVAPVISPAKTLEGLIGGTVCALAISAVAISHLHPFDLGSALVLGALVSVFAPLGDLVESLVKRDLGIKDMGSLLPAHGGLLDRVDAMLFVLVPTYLLVRIAHLG